MKNALAFVLCIVLLNGFVNIRAQAADLTARKLTDSQIAAMSGYSAAQLKKAITTPADAIAYLDKRFPSLWMSYHLWQGADSHVAKLRSGNQIIDDTDPNAGRGDIDTTVAYLLSDNMDIGTIYGFWHASDGSLSPIMAVNYIHENGKYIIFDPVLGMQGDKGSRKGPLLPEMTVSSLADYASAISSDSTLRPLIDSLYAVEDGQGITFTDKAAWTTVTEPAISPFYSNKSISDNRYAHIIPENITKYRLPKMLGGLTMTVADAKTLVGQTPAVIKTKVKTAGDLLLYMLAARLLLKNGDEQIVADGHDWHYNDPAQVTLSQNLGNCGRMANLANYLLEGDYEQIGFILHSYLPSAGGGGHVYNYIKYQGKYYIVDFSSYLFDNYDPSSEPTFISMDNLADYGTRWKECYGGLASIIAHTSTGTHLPNVWEGNYCYYPEGAKFTVLMQTPECMVSTMPCPSSVPDWTQPQGILSNAEPPTILTQPVGTTVSIGQSASLSVKATGTGTLSFQWYMSSDNSTTDGQIIRGATDTTYSFPEDVAGTRYYYCVVTNSDSNATGNMAAETISNVAKVVVRALSNAHTPTILMQPAGKIVLIGDTVTLKVQAADSGKLTYQWYYNLSNTTAHGTLIKGATSSVFSIKITTAGTRYYYCIVTNTDSNATGKKSAHSTSRIAKIVAKKRN